MKTTAPYPLPSTRFKRNATLWTLSALVMVGVSYYIGADPAMLFAEFHYVFNFLGDMVPPHFAPVFRDHSIGYSIVETLCMAFLGTVIGGTIAILMAFMAAANTMPYRFVRAVFSFLLSALRVVPVLVLILVFVVTVGLGPAAGTLALVWGIIGPFGQLFVEVIENAEPAPAEAIHSVGATRWQVIRYAIIPQVIPSFIANLFYSYDVNVRAAIPLGIFGGGGIGFQLLMSMRVMHYRDSLALICVIVVLIAITERVSDFLRSRIMGRSLR